MLDSLLLAPNINYAILSGFVLATAVLGISPGPDNLFVLTQSLSNGVKSGISVVLGLATGCLVHTTLLAFGISEIIKRSDTLFWCIKLFGVIYLLFLAFKVFRSEGHIQFSSGDTTKRALGKLFWRGFTMNVLNPKVTIFFLAFFPGFLFSTDMNTILQFYILGFLFIAVTLLIFGGIALLSGSISNIITKNPKSGVVLKWMQIFVFVGIAIYLLVSDK